MKRRYVLLGLALVAALGIASPVFGLSKSLKQAIKKEVAKQVAKATGPTGPAGPQGVEGVNGLNGVNGVNGVNGADGTARAYAAVRSHADTPCNPGCAFSLAKGVSAVERVDTGTYCVTAPGIDATAVPAALTVRFSTTAAPRGNASVEFAEGDCGPNGFLLVTERQPSVAVRNAADNGSVNVAGNANVADDVGFTIVIP